MREGRLRGPYSRDGSQIERNVIKDSELLLMAVCLSNCKSLLIHNKRSVIHISSGLWGGGVGGCVGEAADSGFVTDLFGRKQTSLGQGEGVVLQAESVHLRQGRISQGSDKFIHQLSRVFYPSRIMIG